MSTAFVEGLRSAFRAVFFVTLTATVLSALRGKERRGKPFPRSSQRERNPLSTP
ncbi:MAG: hypothetical protein ACP5HQ_03090 [Thermoprotei archaeon]